MRSTKLYLTTLALILAGCQSTGTRDSDGQTTSLTDPKIVSAEDADINLPRFINTRSLEIERSIRDNGVAVAETYRTGGTLLAVTERATSALFSTVTEDRLKRPENLGELLKGNARRYGAENPRPAPQGQHGKIVGYYSENGNCAAFAVGYKLRVADNYPWNIDTVVKFSGCVALTEDVQSVIAKLGRPTDADRAIMASRLN